MKDRTLIVEVAALAAAVAIFIVAAEAGNRSPTLEPGFVPATGQINPGHAAEPWSDAAMMMQDNRGPSADQSPTPAQNGEQLTAGAVEQSDGNLVPQNPSLPKLHLNDAQRERIRQTLLTKNTEVETKSAKNFTPKIGAKLPEGVNPDGLPSELTQQIPQLADYWYSKMKDQILLVNGLTGEIVEIIPETQPQTTGQT